MTYRISKEAQADLENIWLYTLENWSAEQADRYVNLILDEIEYLSSKPDSGVDVKHIRKGYFLSKVKAHLLFYRVNPAKKELELIRVLHERMDIESHL